VKTKQLIKALELSLEQNGNKDVLIHAYDESGYPNVYKMGEFLVLAKTKQPLLVTSPIATIKREGENNG